ncbi:hypothetical protein OC842_004138 [Tilletia horrida]|uniref:Apple domain-containing protein n=1 Tax=Tilletia horrida TaxID=155126 RepID=A0AAN6GA97_9BASI|nr:hypothetical protein OC842_004138 [Tilletia horrida]
MKITSLGLAVTALAALAAPATATVTLTSTQCTTRFASTKGTVKYTTSTSTKTIHKTYTQTTTPILSVTPAPSTVFDIATATTTVVTTAPADTDTVTVTTTQTDTATTTTQQTASTTITLAVPTVTITSTTTAYPPAGFTPVGNASGRRRRHGRLERDGRGELPRNDEPLERSAPSAAAADDDDDDDLLARSFHPGAFKSASQKRYPRKVECEIDIIKKIKTTKYIQATEPTTVTASPRTVTATRTTTLSSTTTVVPPDVTATATATATTTVTTTTTQTTTATATETPPAITEQASATYYAACGSSNQHEENYLSSYLTADDISQSDALQPSAYDCCASCVTNSLCAGTIYFANGRTCRTLSTDPSLSNLCYPSRSFGVYGNAMPYNPAQGKEIISNGYCGRWTRTRG